MKECEIGEVQECRFRNGRKEDRQREGKKERRSTALIPVSLGAM